MFKVVYRTWRARLSSHGIVSYFMVERCTDRACTVMVQYSEGIYQTRERCRVLRGTSRPDCFTLDSWAYG